MIQNNQGKILEFPIIPSYYEGLSPIEYFVITHGARKGASDTALNTAKAGYLTRRLVDVAQDVVITEEDCGTKEGKIVTRENISGIEIPLSKNIRGRVLAGDLKDKNGKVLYKKGFLVTKEEAYNIEGAGFTEVFVRSPLTCKTVHGLCVQCYGLDLGRNHLVRTRRSGRHYRGASYRRTGHTADASHFPRRRRGRNGYHHWSSSRGRNF